MTRAEHSATGLLHSNERGQRPSEAGGQEGGGEVDVMIMLAVDPNGHHILDGPILVNVLE